MNREKIIDIIKRKGPLLPLQLSKELELNSIMAGAYLSELVSENKVNISNLKIGGSPVYYVEGQEDKLQNYIYALKEPEQKAVNMLREKKLIKDSELESLTRVSLQNAKDFAKPIEITIKGQKELYWKWYLLSNEDVQSILKGKTNNIESKNEERDEEKKTEEAPEKEPEKEAGDNTEDNEGQDKGHKDKEEESGHVPEPDQEEVTEKKDPGQSPEEKTSWKDEEVGEHELLDKCMKFFEENEISVLSKEVVRQTEVHFRVLIPSPVGKLHYFVTAKSKKKCNDSDLAQLFVNAELKKMPGLFLYTGELTKKAREKLKEFKNLAVKNI